jgi:anti-anti-sigma factor
MTFSPTDIQIRDNIAIVTPAKQLDAEGNEPPFYLEGVEERDEFEKVIQRCLTLPEISHVVLDLRNIGRLNSTGLGVLISSFASLDRSGKKLVLTNVDPRIRNVLVITKVEPLMEIYPTREEALAKIATG